jgi:hypothetical protein
MDMGVHPDADRSAGMEVPVLLQDGDIVDVDAHALLAGQLIFLQADAVGGVKDIVRGEAGQKSQFHFLNGNTVQSCAQRAEKPEHMDIAVGLAGITDFGGGHIQGLDHASVLVFHHVPLIDIEGGVIAGGDVQHR